MKHKIGLLIIGFALVAAACGNGDSGEDATTTTEATTTTTEATTTTTEATTTTTEAAAVTFTGADGVESAIMDTSRIVSLNGDLTEIIYELGFGDSVVAVDVTTTYPPETDSLKDGGGVVGFGQQLAPEPVLAFEPTLVLGDTQIAPSETIEQIRDAGVPVVILEYQTTLDGVETKIMQVAEILGVPEKGKELSARVNGEIDEALALAAQATETPNVAFVYIRGPQVVFLFGGGMPTSAMIEGAGAVDVAKQTGVFGVAVLTPEALVAAAPDVIVVPASGFEALGGADAFLEIQGVADTPAGKAGAFLPYDEAYFFNFGPRVGLALLDFVKDLHPELAANS
jgi:iron complex transport system substrate-binding protein